MSAARAGPSALLLIDIVEVPGSKGIGYTMIRAMAAAVRVDIRASLDADALYRRRAPSTRKPERETAP